MPTLIGVCTINAIGVCTINAMQAKYPPKKYNIPPHHYTNIYRDQVKHTRADIN